MVSLHRITLVLLSLAACADDQLSGMPGEPLHGFTVEPDRLLFGESYLTCQKRRGLLLRNTGSEPLIVTASLPSGPFALDGSARWSLDPDATVEVAVTFSPTLAGPAAELLTLAADGAAALVPLEGTGSDRPPPEVDMLFAVDVSTSMDEEMVALYDALAALFDYAQGNGVDLHAGLATFVNDVIVHRGGQPLDRGAFFAELDTQLVDRRPNGSLDRNDFNSDYPENILDALYLLADSFPFRDAPRTLLLLTDDTFLTPPSVYSDGSAAVYSYSAVQEQLVGRAVRLVSVHDPELGQGLSAPFEGAPSLVSATGGRWYDVAGVDSGTVDLTTLLLDVVQEHACP